MKPETEKAILARSNEEKQEIIALLARDMPAGVFARALIESDGKELTANGFEIHASLDTHVEPTESLLLDEDAERLHEMICEGRRQDAVDFLNEISSGDLRRVEAQENLFPGRVPPVNPKTPAAFADALADF